MNIKEHPPKKKKNPKKKPCSQKDKYLTILLIHGIEKKLMKAEVENIVMLSLG